MTSGIVRARFTEGQFLGSDDLTAEQAYREDAARRHRIGAHSWGIVSGLQLQGRPGALTVTPGLAVDGYGRTLVVTSPLEVQTDTTEGERDVWLSLAPAPSRKGGAPGGRRPAGTSEITAICLAPAGPVNPRFPPGVPPAHMTHPPHAAIGAPPGPWPVYLGRISWNGPNPLINNNHRVYAGLTGEAVTAPSGRARLQIGAESSADPVRFAIATEQVPAAPDAAPHETPRAGPPSLTTQLVIERAGALTVYGTTTLNGDLVITPPDPPRTGTHTGIKFSPTAEPTTAAPWTLYRTQIQRHGRTVNQLRIEIGHPGDGGDPTRNRFVIGSRDNTNSSSPRFCPCLSVDADCTVTVHHKLHVMGLLSESPIEPDRTDPRFAAEAFDSFAYGFVGAASRLMDALKTAKLEVTVKPGQSNSEPRAGQQFNYTVSVTNTDSGAATSGEVYVVISIGEHQSIIRPLSGAIFQKDTPHELPEMFKVPENAGGGTLTISALAVAVDPIGRVISADGSLSIEIPGPLI